MTERQLQKALAVIALFVVLTLLGGIAVGIAIGREEKKARDAFKDARDAGSATDRATGTWRQAPGRRGPTPNGSKGE